MKYSMVQVRKCVYGCTNGYRDKSKLIRFQIFANERYEANELAKPLTQSESVSLLNFKN